MQDAWSLLSSLSLSLSLSLWFGQLKHFIFHPALIVMTVGFLFFADSGYSLPHWVISAESLEGRGTSHLVSWSKGLDHQQNSNFGQLQRADIRRRDAFKLVLTLLWARIQQVSCMHKIWLIHLILDKFFLGYVKSLCHSTGPRRFCFVCRSFS